MATTHRDDILLPAVTTDRPPSQSPILAFVPITVALIGVAAILLGGVTARGKPDIDPVVTGAIEATPLPTEAR